MSHTLPLLELSISRQPLFFCMIKQFLAYYQYTDRDSPDFF